MPSEHIQKTSKQRVQDVCLTSCVLGVLSQNICVLRVEMVLHVRTLNMLQVLDV